LAFLDFLNDGDTPEKPVHRLVAMIPLAMVLFAVAYNFYTLYPEVGIQVLGTNDSVLHLAALDRASPPIYGSHHRILRLGRLRAFVSRREEGTLSGGLRLADQRATGCEATPIIKFQRESGEAEPAFLLSNAEYLMAQAQTPAGPSRGDVYAEASGSNIYLAEVSVERESVLMFAEAKTVMLMPSYI